MLLIKIKLNYFGQIQNGTNEENQESTKGQNILTVFGYAYDYKRDPIHSINEHVIHVVNMIKCLEVEYMFQSSHKKRILQMLLTESEDKVLENMWEFVQEGSHGLTNRSFDDVVALFKEHWQIYFVKNMPLDEQRCFLFLLTRKM